MQEGAELYLLPAIDMINHATDPARRNATLERPGMVVQPNGSRSAGYFSLKASEYKARTDGRYSPMAAAHQLQPQIQ